LLQASAEKEGIPSPTENSECGVSLHDN
jgi:hypothetical protein